MPRRFVWHPSRGPDHTPKAITTKGQVEIKQVRSGIGHCERMRATLRALGLRHHQAVVIREHTPAVAGQIKYVRHLVRVTPVGK
jgi:large subunit ribosomal protein L30